MPCRVLLYRLACTGIAIVLHTRFACLIRVASSHYWASIEGISEHWWPSRTVLQKLDFEGHPTGSVALLVGSTTLSHWSLAIAVLEKGF